MKHECHCGLNKHLKHLRAKKLGIVGAMLMLVHILFHVVECLILPAIIVGVTEQATSAKSAEAKGYARQVRIDHTDGHSLFVPQWSSNETRLLTFSETTAAPR